MGSLSSWRSAVASSEIWVDGFKAILGDYELPNFSVIQFQNMSFYWILFKINGFENPSLKIDGFGWTPADEAPDVQFLYEYDDGNKKKNILYCLATRPWE